MDTESDFSVSYSCPNVYRVELASMKDLAITFAEILEGVSFSGVEGSLVDYVTSVVEPIGWKAVWRSTKDTSPLDLEYDFIAEVTNVSLCGLEAEIHLKSVIIDDEISSSLDYLKEGLNIENPRNVPLRELYVVSEDDHEEFFQKTAIAIEHVRFYYKHICRPWDDEPDFVYTEEIIKTRVQLYFDMKNNIIPKTMISKIKSILKEGTRIAKELKQLYSDMGISDSEAEIGEDDFMHSVALKTKLQKLHLKMEMLENPVIRSFLAKKYSPSNALKKPAKSGPMTYVVAKEFTKEIIEKILHFEITTTIEFEHNPESAFKCSTAGDKIFIFPGIYQCDTLGWIESDISVEGVGENADIVLEATGNSEVFLNIWTEKFEIKNITLKAKHKLFSNIIIHHGEAEFKNCIMDSNGAKRGLLLLGGAEAIVENSTISNSCKDGVQMRSSSTLTMKSSKVVFSKRHGIQIDAECGLSPDSFTTINLTNSQISNNGRYGIFLHNVPIAEISLQRPSGDFNVLGLFPWLKHEVKDTFMEHNQGNGIGISTSCQNNANLLSESTFQISRKAPNQKI